MKKLILSIMIATTLVTSQANAYWFLGAKRQHEGNSYAKNIDHYGDVYFGIMLVITLVAVTNPALWNSMGYLWLLDVNATDGSSEQALTKAVPELASKPELTQELIKLAQNGKSEILQTEKGEIEAHYIDDEILNPFLAQSGLSNESIEKISIIFSKNHIQESL